MRVRNRGAWFAAAFALITLSARAKNPALEVRGSEFFFNEKPVMLRGVAVGDTVLARAGRPLSDFTTIARDWHANIVRIDIHPSVWKSMPHKIVLEKLSAEVHAALAAGLFVIIDWHTIGWPDGYFEATEFADDPVDLYDSNFALAQSFWAEVSERFGGDGRIIFELWNEPVFQKNDFEPQAGAKWPQLKAYMEKMLATVRAHSGNVVLATSNYWAYNLRGIRTDLLAGHNIAYAWHIYAGHEDDDSRAWAVALDDLQTAAPVIVTEWGFQRGSKESFAGTPDTFGKKFVRDFLEAKKLHSTAWCWHPEWTPVMLKKDWKTPTEFGAFVKKYLRESGSEKAF